MKANNNMFVSETNNKQHYSSIFHRLVLYNSTFTLYSDNLYILLLTWKILMYHLHGKKSKKTHPFINKYRRACIAKMYQCKSLLGY
jgi:hypothetical protein